ncbi:MAG: NAD(P)H-dependent glycerol-3-phosphate dehydrogenase [Syntrophomonadaceae bacterium]|jgi:glycerol-3-phosphate dehydrogenase (NAD(P)+)
MTKICILGAGSWGTAQAIHLHQNGARIVIWGRMEDGIDLISKHHKNERFLPGVIVPEGIIITDNIEEAVTYADIVVLAVPSQAIREISTMIKPFISDKCIIVNSSKGLEIGTGMRLSQVVEDVLGKKIKDRYAVISGPSHAEEVARNMPTAATVAAYNRDIAFYVQDKYMSASFRIYTNPDVAGVELGGSLKNIIALGTGIAKGLGFGDNTQAALITRGLTEITRMGEAMGGNPRTFSGLSGIGDLIVTCLSDLSRNRRAGILLGRGFSLEETLNVVGMVVEGVHATRAVHKKAEELKIDMPITRACYNILYNRKSAQEEVNKLMTRRKKHEIEEIVENTNGW